MNDLIEKVARVLFEYDQQTDETQFRDWEKDHARLGAYYRELARAALNTVAVELINMLRHRDEASTVLRTPPASAEE